MILERITFVLVPGQIEVSKYTFEFESEQDTELDETLAHSRFSKLREVRFVCQDVGVEVGDLSAAIRELFGKTDKKGIISIYVADLGVTS